MGDAAEHVFGNISLGTRAGASQGSLKAKNIGLVWKGSGGGRTVEIPAAEIKGCTWSKTSRGCMLAVDRTDGPVLCFLGFRDNDLQALRSLALAATIKEEPLAVSGHNWGDVEMDGASLVFRVGGRPAFFVPLPDVAQAQLGKEDVQLQFPVDDNHAANTREDALVEMSFHVPRDCPDFPPPEATEAPAAGTDGEPAPAAVPAAKRFYDALSAFTDVDAATGDAIATFDAVGVLVPRGRFDVEMFSSSLKLVGQAQDFRVQYDAILRIFVLPKANAPQTLVAVCLDPPIRKGQTYYTTILCQFHNEEDTAIELDLTPEALAARNEKGAKLTRAMTGASPDIFARVLRGLSGAKLTRPGSFRDAAGDGHAVRCNYKADDGHLYPLERAFFYVQKPPLLMAHDDIDSVEFLRQAQGVTAAKTFDLAVRMKSGQDHLFRGIPRSEWTNLFEWIQAKALRVENFKEAQRGPGAAAVSYAEDGGGVDAGIAGLGAAGALDSEGEEDEEDEDFAAASESSSSDGDDSGSDGEGVGGEAPRKKPRTEAAGAPKEKKAPAVAAAAAGGKEKKPRKKKDKDAPKKALSAFMYFSSAKRDQVKADNPGISFGEVGKRLGELWKAATPEDKVPFESQAEADKGRYARAMEAYNAAKKGADGGGGGGAAGGGSDLDSE